MKKPARIGSVFLWRSGHLIALKRNFLKTGQARARIPQVADAETLASIGQETDDQEGLESSESLFIEENPSEDRQG